MNDVFIEVSPEIIKALKATGYQSVQIVSKDDKENHHRTIELIPLRSLDFQLDQVPLDSPELYDYISKQSPMVKYIINKEYLPDAYTV